MIENTNSPLITKNESFQKGEHLPTENLSRSFDISKKKFYSTRISQKSNIFSEEMKVFQINALL